MMNEKSRRVKILGKTLTGENRTYEFELVAPKIGVAIQNEYRFLLMSNATSIAELAAWMIENISNGLDLGKKEDGMFVRAMKILKIITTVTPVVEMLPQVITPARMEELAAKLLAGGSVDGEVIDDEGMCSMFGHNVAELDAALFHAVMANFPYLGGWISPLLEALSKGGEKEEVDTTPVSQNQQQQILM
jgi:hypothetical protein